MCCHPSLSRRLSCSVATRTYWGGTVVSPRHDQMCRAHNFPRDLSTGNPGKQRKSCTKATLNASQTRSQRSNRVTAPLFTQCLRCPEDANGHVHVVVVVIVAAGLPLQQGHTVLSNGHTGRCHFDSAVLQISLCGVLPHGGSPMPCAQGSTKCGSAGLQPSRRSCWLNRERGGMWS